MSFKTYSVSETKNISAENQQRYFEPNLYKIQK